MRYIASWVDHSDQIFIPSSFNSIPTEHRFWKKHWLHYNMTDAFVCPNVGDASWAHTNWRSPGAKLNKRHIWLCLDFLCHHFQLLYHFTFSVKYRQVMVIICSEFKHNDEFKTTKYDSNAARVEAYIIILILALYQLPTASYFLQYH